MPFFVPSPLSFSSSANLFKKGGFTVVEVMVAILIFTIGFLWAYLLVNAGLTISAAGHDEIIASGINAEQLELLHNLRDSNWIQNKYFDSLTSAKIDTQTPDRLTAGFYTIQNSFTANHPISVRYISAKQPTQAQIADALNGTTNVLRLCLDSQNRYTHDCSTGNTPTHFVSFLGVSPLVTKTGNTNISVPNAWLLTAYTVSSNRGYRQYVITTVITDWKKE